MASEHATFYWIRSQALRRLNLWSGGMLPDERPGFQAAARRRGSRLANHLARASPYYLKGGRAASDPGHADGLNTIPDGRIIKRAFDPNERFAAKAWKD